MIEEILKFRSQSVPIAKIAQECRLTIGQVKYLLSKTPLASDAPSPKDLITLHVYAPTTLLVAWNLTRARMVMVASYLGADQQELKRGVRLYDVTGISFTGSNANNWVDVMVEGEETTCFIPNIRAGCSYLAEFGLFHEERFYPILRSEEVLVSDKHLFRPDAEFSGEYGSDFHQSKVRVSL